MNENIARLNGQFATEHLSEELAAVSKPFGRVATGIVKGVKGGTLHPADAEHSLRKLLEAKDAAVRAVL